MRFKTGFTLFVLGALAAVPALGQDAGEAEPDVIVVQHLLIGFKRSVPGKKLERTKREARALAEKLFRRAREGEDFDALVEEHTDDAAPGVMRVTNEDAPRRSDARTRGQLVASFGDVAFGLDVGEIGLAEFHGFRCPYGWHVIKRLE